MRWFLSRARFAATWVVVLAAGGCAVYEPGAYPYGYYAPGYGAPYYGPAVGLGFDFTYRDGHGGRHHSRGWDRPHDDQGHGGWRGGDHDGERHRWR